MACPKLLFRLALVLSSAFALRAAGARPLPEPADGVSGWVTTTYGCHPGVAERVEVAMHLDDGRVVPLRNAQVPERTTRVRASPAAVAEIDRTGSLDLLGAGCDGPFLDCTSELGGGSGALGAQRIVVILVNFASDPEEPIAAKEADDLLVDAGEWYGEVSFDQVWFSVVDVFGYYTVNVDPGSSHGDIADAALALADPDVDFTQYDRIVYGWHNGDNFSYGSIGQHPLQTQDGEVIVSEAYMQTFTTSSGGLLRHELGHNFGLGHARNLSSIDGTTQTYGNTADTMGSGYSSSIARHFGARSKVQLGWLPPESIFEVTASGAYTIGPLELEHGHPYALKIFKEQISYPGGPTYDVHYFLELRQPVGSDAGLPFNLTDGPILMTATESFATSTTVDCTPETPSHSLADGALLGERTYFDPDADVVLSAGNQAGYVHVEVRFDVSPANQPPWHDTIWDYEKKLPGGGSFVWLFAGVGDGDSDRLYHFWRFPFQSGAPNPFYTSPEIWGLGPRPMLTFPDATPRRAFLTASDSDGASAGWAYFDIFGPVANTPPVVEQTAVVFEPHGEFYAFSATVADAEADMILYHWDFGDGQTSPLPSPTHVFDGAPPATVELTVSDVQYEHTVQVPIP